MPGNSEIRLLYCQNTGYLNSPKYSLKQSGNILKEVCLFELIRASFFFVPKDQGHRQQLRGWPAHLSSGRESRCGHGSCTAFGPSCTSSGWSLVGWLLPRWWSAAQGRPGRAHKKRKLLPASGAGMNEDLFHQGYYPIPQHSSLFRCWSSLRNSG